ncbi:MFS transporter, partial [Listeria monocytogenes]|nr:MFS transporter [Listeria monocytogenes]
TAFKIMGAVYIAVVIGCSFLIRVAPAGYAPKGWTPPANNAAGMVNVPWTGMVRTVTFYLILLMLGIGAFSGLMIASNASLIGQNMFGLTAASAAAYVSIYSLSNCLGRVVWGAVSDRLGRSNTLMIIYTVIALSLLALATLQSVVGFVIGIIGLG